MDYRPALPRTMAAYHACDAITTASMTSEFQILFRGYLDDGPGPMASSRDWIRWACIRQVMRRFTTHYGNA